MLSGTGVDYLNDNISIADNVCNIVLRAALPGSLDFAVSGYRELWMGSRIFHGLVIVFKKRSREGADSVGSTLPLRKRYGRVCA